MTDTDALQRYVRQRDPDALAHLIESYQQMVYAVCLRRLGHEADARDATQDTFLKLAKSAGDVRGSLAGWLHHCATTTSLDLIRSSARRRRRERAATEAAARSASAADPEWAEVRAALDEALDKLPDDQRDLIVQRFLVGRKQNELAAELGVSESMTSRYIKAAVEDLRQRLRAKGFGVGLAALTTGLAAESALALPAGLNAGLTSAGVAGVAASAGTSGISGATGGALGTGATWLVGGAAVVVLVSVLSVVLYLALSAPPPDDTARAAVTTTAVSIDGRILRPTETSAGRSTSSSTGPGGYFKAEGNSVAQLVKEAYGVPSEQYVVFDTLEPEQQYDAEIRGEDWHGVLRDALREELGLAGQRERRVLTAYALRLPAGGEHTLTPVDPGQRGGSLTVGGNGALFRDAHVGWLRMNLENWLDAPVLDETGVEGHFNYLLDAGPNPGFADYAQAVERDLGLELVEIPGGREFDVVVVGRSKQTAPPLTNSVLAGEWVAFTEDREGNLVKEAADAWVWRSVWEYGHSELTITTADGSQRIRWHFTTETMPDGREQRFQTLIEVEGADSLRGQLGQKMLAKIGVSPGLYRIQGDRMYAQSSALNPETGEMETIPAGEFDSRGYRAVFIRPHAVPGDAPE
ncbi:MAG: TIGR03435 family protein [Planctomycetota bacterium]